MRLVAILTLAVLSAGCEWILGLDEPRLAGADGEDPGRGDAGVGPIGEARLGFPCGDAHRENGFGGGCPGESRCIFSLGNVGSPDGSSGYCSPLCAGDPAVCHESYDGPPEGDPICGPPELGVDEVCIVGLTGGCAELGDGICPADMHCAVLVGDLVGCVPKQWGGDVGGDTFANLLGLACGPDFSGNGFGGSCPERHICVVGVGELRDPSGRPNGYCSPDCATDGNLCSENYTGPPEGNPLCIDSPDGSGVRACVSGFAGGGCAQFGDTVCPRDTICHTLETPDQMFEGCGGQTWAPPGEGT